jgi:transcriptional regulator with XRE-family HTH domain
LIGRRGSCVYRISPRRRGARSRRRATGDGVEDTPLLLARVRARLLGDVVPLDREELRYAIGQHGARPLRRLTSSDASRRISSLTSTFPSREAVAAKRDTTRRLISSTVDLKGRRVELNMASALAERLEKIKELGGITGRDVAQLLDTTPETVSRWTTGKIDPQRERLRRLLELEFFLTELSEFYSPEEAKLWLFSPHKLLGGETAAARIQAGKTQDVFAILDQLRSGAYI